MDIYFLWLYTKKGKTSIPYADFSLHSFAIARCVLRTVSNDVLPDFFSVMVNHKRRVSEENRFESHSCLELFLSILPFHQLLIQKNENASKIYFLFLKFMCFLCKCFLCKTFEEYQTVWREFKNIPNEIRWPKLSIKHHDYTNSYDYNNSTKTYWRKRLKNPSWIFCQPKPSKSVIFKGHPFQNQSITSRIILAEFVPPESESTAFSLLNVFVSTY